MVRFLGWILAVVALAMPVRAEMPAGCDDPRFKAAVVAWLNADDYSSLPSLAALAREGSAAAQILLARIELNRRHPGPRPGQLAEWSWEVKL